MNQELEPYPTQVIPEEPEQVIPVEPEQVIPDEDLGMSLIVANDEGELVLRDPVTGGALDGSATPEQLVEYRTHLAWIKRAVGEAQTECDARLIRAMDRNAKWTVHGPGRVKASAPSAGLQYADVVDASRLFVILTDLVATGELTQEAMDAAIETETSYKTKKAGMNALRKLPVIEAAIAECFTTVEVDRRVTLKGA